MCSCLAFSCLWYCSWPPQRRVVQCIWSLPLCMLPNPSSSWISCCLALRLSSWLLSWSCKNFLGFHLHLLTSAGKWAGGNASICFLGPSVRLLCSALWEKNKHQTQRTYVMFSQKLSPKSTLTQQEKPVLTLPFWKDPKLGLNSPQKKEPGNFQVSIDFPSSPFHVEIRDWIWGTGVVVIGSRSVLPSLRSPASRCLLPSPGSASEW